MTRPARALALGALAVGTLDILDAFIFFGVRSGAKPVRILQSIAAGLLGRETAVAGGVSTAALGLALHFFIATTIVLVYWLASRGLPVLRRHPIALGALYGIGAYVVMNYVVIPLSAVGGGRAPAGAVLANGLLIHIFGVGIPAALAARAAGGHPEARGAQDDADRADHTDLLRERSGP